jgi:arginyl-tRNA synthetase
MIPLLEEKFSAALDKSFPGLDVQIEVTESTNDKFGHYQFNSAMKMAKAAAMSPRDIAAKIVQNLPQDEMIDKVEIAGPGFINVHLSPLFLAKRTEALLSPLPKGKKEKIIVDFSSPNVAKELHVGHLRSTIIGDTLARLFEYLGHDVLRLNHVGDFGTQFGMLIAYLRKAHPEISSGTQTASLPELMQWYKESKLKFDSDPEFKKESQLAVVELQQGDQDAVRIWKIICEISQKGYQEIYDLLGVRIQERGESFYSPFLKDTVTELEKLGLVEISNGAKCLYVDGFINREGDPLPLIVQKSDGGYNYDTTDMAAIKHRIEVEKADRIVYVTDMGQGQHFQMIFKAAEKAGWLKPQKTRVDHVGFGLVLGPDGKKFKTRSGETEKLIDLLTKAIDEADRIISERSPEMDAESRRTLAKALGLSAIKYSDLACHRTSDYSFSYEKMLKFEGNTAAFLMYSYVRILGIQRKVGQADSADIKLVHPSEIALGLHLSRFPETLTMMTQDLLPHRLTEYLYQLAEKFNGFFRDCRVEGAEEQASRLRLCEVTAHVMKQGFDILGLTTVEKM